MKAIPNDQKLRGGFYTPSEIAEFLVQWAVQSPRANVLEPSCGDGTFFRPIVERLGNLGSPLSLLPNQITAVEFDEIEYNKALNHLKRLIPEGEALKVFNEDFFTLCIRILGNERYDAIVGNPPFIRYQNFPDSHRDAAFRLMKSFGLHPTKLTNAWLPFVVMATELLAENGRIAMVVPAEIMQVNYAAELRQFLSDRLDQLTIFAFPHLVFQGIQQEVVLLCGERNSGTNRGIRIIELEDINSLKNYNHIPFEQHLLKPMDHSKEKWTQYFLTKDQNQLIRQIGSRSGLNKLGQLANVDVGIVTGLNDFFVLKLSEIDKIGADDYVIPLASRSSHLKGIIFSKKDWYYNVVKDLPAFLLNIPDVPLDKLPNLLRDYIQEGESLDYHKGFKCRIRNPWFKVPSIWVPDAFMLRQIHYYPKVIVNSADATSTDTIHRVRVCTGINVKQLAGSAYNSLTFVFAEILGRSYGGGVLELEPREAERLPIPYEAAKQLDLDLVDQQLRNGDAEKALDYCDSVLLIDGLGMEIEDVKQLRLAWNLLRNRRINRNRKRRGDKKTN